MTRLDRSRAGARRDLVRGPGGRHGAGRAALRRRSPLGQAAGRRSSAAGKTTPRSRQLLPGTPGTRPRRLQRRRLRRLPPLRADGIKPLFPFGYGLSYTKFKYGAPGGHARDADGDGNVTVSFDVTNTGHREGAEVAQVYVGDGHAPVPRPPKELKGFAKVSLKPGETKRARDARPPRVLVLRRGRSSGARPPGEFEVLVGRSSADIQLTGRLTLTAK